jgi:NADH-quinone oxidoreductase subunit L
VLVSVAMATLGLVAAVRLFGARLPRRDVEPRAAVVEALTRRLRPLYVGSSHGWWLDALNELLFYRLGGRLARAAWWFDSHVIDAAVEGVARVTQRSGHGLRRIQTGRVQNYALGIAIGLIAMAVGYLWIAAR